MTDRAKVLTLSPDLVLPLEAATRRLAILAMSGAGKSNVAVVMAEQMSDAGIPWVAIDPKGDWWGVRSSKSGKGPGLPVPIFGGLHGDVPLEPTAGKLIAELIVEQRLTCVLDVSEFDGRQAMWGFLADLGDVLLRRNRQVLHLFLEECDEYLPQKPSDKGNLLRCLGIWQRVVKRGRFRGLGSTQITQRNASLNKDTLYQAEAIIAMRVTGKADRDAVKGWVEHHNAAAEIVTSLPTLADGEGWLSSPAWLRETKRVQFHRRRTFDAGATPVLLAGAAPAATLADVDLDALRVRMAATIAKAKADDPAELRRRIGALEAELRTARAAKLAPATTVEKVVAQRVEVPILTADQVQRFARAVTRIEQALAQAAGAVDHLVVERGELGKIGHQIQVAVAQACGPESPARRPVQTSAVPRPDTSRDMGAATKSVTRPAPATSARQEAGHDERLTGAQQAILDAAAFLASLGIERPDVVQLALFAGQSATGGYWRGNIGRVRTLGLVEGTALTAAGRARAAESAITTVAQLHAHVLTDLCEGAQKKLLQALIDIYPAGMSAQELGERVGMEPAGGYWRGCLGRLRSLGLVTKSGPIAARPVLFLEESTT